MFDPGTQATIPVPVIGHDDFGRSYVDLSVMTYNIHNLPPPLRMDAAEGLTLLESELRRMRDSGTAPDVLLIQEGFGEDVAGLQAAGGYRYHISGPSAEAEGVPGPRDAALEDDVSFFKGETLGPVLNSGLHVFSRYEIAHVDAIAYGPQTCAGFDCLANKGAVMVSVHIPGAPEDVQLFTTHMNAKKASGVSETRSNAAYRLQMLKLGSFLREALDPARAVIFGGDFNTKKSAERRTVAEAELSGLSATHQACAKLGAGCSLNVDYDPEVSWTEARDLQGYRSGRNVEVKPLSLGLAFEKPVNGRAISDHPAMWAAYRLSWRASSQIAMAQPGN